MASVDFASMSFLLTLFLVLVSGVRNKPRRHKSKRRVRCICVLWCFDRDLKYHLNLEVWISFLILSCLSVFLPQVDAHEDQSLADLREILVEIAPLINTSSALLYTPPDDALHLFKNCTHEIMRCFLLELNVTLFEEEDSSSKNMNNTKNDIFVIMQDYKDIIVQCEHCTIQCETFQVENFATFHERMKTYVEKLSSLKHHDNSHSDDNNCLRTGA